MPEELDKKGTEPDEPVTPTKRTIFSLRNAGILAALVAFVALAFFVTLYVAYRGGVVDTYVEDQFTAKMADIGIVFDADEFDVTISPFELHLVNATFNNKTTGEKLFFIRDVRRTGGRGRARNAHISPKDSRRGARRNSLLTSAGEQS